MFIDFERSSLTLLSVIDVALKNGYNVGSVVNKSVSKYPCV